MLCSPQVTTSVYRLPLTGPQSLRLHIPYTYINANLLT